MSHPGSTLHASSTKAIFAIFAGYIVSLGHRTFQ